MLDHAGVIFQGVEAFLTQHAELVHKIEEEDDVDGIPDDDDMEM
jgi:hypothetical protein